jgi:hypothetical protein
MKKIIYVLTLLPKGVVGKIFSFATGVKDTTLVVHFELRISPRIFEKIHNSPYGILRGLGETDS